jgi:hypothetical protein
MSETINILTGLDLDRIALVKAGANLKRRFTVTKSVNDQGETVMDAKELEVVQKKLVDQAAELSEVQKNNEIMKTANEELKKSLAAVASENELIKKALKETNDARELDQWVSKAKTELSHFPGQSAEDLGKMLKSLNDVNPEMAKIQFSAMKTTSDTMKSSPILKEAGKDNASPASCNALEEIVKLADGIVAKDSKISKSSAFVQVCKDKPGLYKQYLAENPKQDGK